MLSRNIGVKIEKGEINFIKSLDYILKEVDILCGNLESPISDTAPKIGIFRAPKKSIEIIKPFKLLNLANNHIYDSGSEGIRDTMYLLEEYKILNVGIGTTFSQAYRPACIEMKGQKVAFFGCVTPEIFRCIKKSNGEYYIATLGNYLEIAVEEMKSKVDFIIVLVHGGNEFIPFPPPSLKVNLENLILKGADLIVTHHPHVLGGYQIIKRDGGEKLIWYSLGDFIFDSFVKKRRETGILTVRINKKLINSFDFIPFYRNENYQLEVPNYKASQSILEKIKFVSNILNYKHYEKIYIKLYIKEFVNFQWEKLYAIQKKEGYIYLVYFIFRKFKYALHFLRKFLAGEYK